MCEFNYILTILFSAFQIFCSTRAKAIYCLICIQVLSVSLVKCMPCIVIPSLSVSRWTVKETNIINRAFYSTLSSCWKVQLCFAIMNSTNSLWTIDFSCFFLLKWCMLYFEKTPFFYVGLWFLTEYLPSVSAELLWVVWIVL